MALFSFIYETALRNLPVLSWLRRMSLNRLVLLLASGVAVAGPSHRLHVCGQLQRLRRWCKTAAQQALPPRAAGWTQNP